MTPLLAIGLQLVPDLAKRLTRGADSAVQKAIIDVVRDVVGTEDPEAAFARAKDAKTAATLRIRLAEIDAAARAAELKAEQDERRAEIDILRTDLKRFSAGLEDREDARSMLENLSGRGSPFAWGPVVVSTVVTTGFFATLIYLIRGGFNPDRIDLTSPGTQLVFQIVNIAVGALTAGFATVVSFWLGSSDGSRRKDLTAVQMQAATAVQQRKQTLATQSLVTAQAEQARTLFSGFKFNTPATTAQPTAKSARQFHACVAVILRHEGGFVDHPRDPGGATNLGITHTTLAAWRGETVTKADVRNLSLDEAREIYRANYWNALNGDALPVGIDLVVFDFGVNAGVSRAARMLQRIIGVADDGQIGPISIAAASRADTRYVVNAFSDARLAYYRKLSHWDAFGRGWTHRTEETREEALDMIDQPALAAAIDHGETGSSGEPSPGVA